MGLDVPTTTNHSEKFLGVHLFGIYRLQNEGLVLKYKHFVFEQVEKLWEEEVVPELEIYIYIRPKKR